MPDAILFNEGATDLINNGLPSTITWDLSTKSVAELSKTDTYAGGFGKITGTGYAAKTESEPTAVNGVVSFAAKKWETGEATDWPAGVKSIVARNGTSHILYAENLRAGGGARDMSAPNTTEEFTPTLTLAVA
jgi:hypothetical protein